MKTVEAERIEEAVNPFLETRKDGKWKYDLLKIEKDWTKDKVFAKKFRDLYEGTRNLDNHTLGQISELMSEAYREQLLEYENKREELYNKGQTIVLGKKEVQFTPEERAEQKLNREQPYTPHFVKYLKSRSEIALFGATPVTKKRCEQKIKKGESEAQARRYLVPNSRFLIRELKSKFEETPSWPKSKKFAKLLKSAYMGTPGKYDPLSTEELSFYVRPVSEAVDKKSDRITRAYVHLLMEEITLNEMVESGVITPEEHKRFEKLKMTKRSDLTAEENSERDRIKGLISKYSDFKKPETKGPSLMELQSYAKTRVPEEKRSPVRRPRGLTIYEIAAKHSEMSRANIYNKMFETASLELVSSGRISKNQHDKYLKWRQIGIKNLSQEQQNEYRKYKDLVSLAMEAELGITRGTKKTLLPKRYLAFMWYLMDMKDEKIADMLLVSKDYVIYRRHKLGIKGRRKRLTAIQEKQLRKEWVEEGVPEEVVETRVSNEKRNCFLANKARFFDVMGPDFSAVDYETLKEEMGDRFDLKFDRALEAAV